MTKLQQLHALVDALSTPESLAEQFCELDDDQQAKFFVAVAGIMDAWPRNAFGAPAGQWQALAIGSHLATCSCATEDAREFVRFVIEGMNNPSHGAEEQDQ